MYKKFKAGDKVICVKNYVGYIKGDIYPVYNWNGYDELVNFEKNTHGHGNYVNYLLDVFEPFVDESKEQELLQKANEGRQKLVELHKLVGNRLEFRGDKQEKWLNFSLDVDLYEYRIIPPKKEFKTFVVGKNWKVDVDSEKFRVKIGCKDFDKDWLKNSLHTLLYKPETNSCSIGHYNLQACRTGISSNGNTITWLEAEMIYGALVEYDGK